MIDEVVQVYNMLADNGITSAYTLHHEYLRDICVGGLKKQVGTNGMIHIYKIQKYFIYHELEGRQNVINNVRNVLLLMKSYSIQNCEGRY